MRRHLFTTIAPTLVDGSLDHDDTSRAKARNLRSHFSVPRACIKSRFKLSYPVFAPLISMFQIIHGTASLISCPLHLRQPPSLIAWPITFNYPYGVHHFSFLQILSYV